MDYYSLPLHRSSHIKYISFRKPSLMLRVFVILICQVNKLRGGGGQSKLVQIKDRNGATINDKKRVKEG